MEPVSMLKHEHLPLCVGFSLSLSLSHALWGTYCRRAIKGKTARQNSGRKHRQTALFFAVPPSALTKRSLKRFKRCFRGEKCIGSLPLWRTCRFCRCVQIENLYSGFVAWTRIQRLLSTMQFTWAPFVIRGTSHPDWRTARVRFLARGLFHLYQAS